MRMLRHGYPWNVVLGALLVLLTPVVVVGASLLVATAVTRLPSDAAFRADGAVVTRTALQQRSRVLAALYGIRAPTDGPQLDMYRRSMAHSVMVSTVVDDELAARHLALPPEAAERLLNDFIAQGVAPPGQDGFVQLLRSAGASESDVRDELARQSGAMTLYQEIASPAAGAVDARAVQEYYDTHPSEMVFAEQRHLRNIVVSTKAQADELVADIRGGADFAAVAKQSSLDAKTRDTGGDIGWVTGDRLEDSYSGAAFSAAPGSVFGPAQTHDGWNIGQVLETRPQVQLTLDQVRGQLTDWLRQQKGSEAWQSWLQARVARADVTFADEYRPMAPSPAVSPVPQPAKAVSQPVPGAPR